MLNTMDNHNNTKQATPEQVAKRHAALVWLYESFPLAFTHETRALKIGIHKDILSADLENMPPKQQIRLALSYYVNAYKYLDKLKTGAERIDLAGVVSGHVLESEEVIAQNKLRMRRKQLFANRKKKIEQEKALNTAALATDATLSTHEAKEVVHTDNKPAREKLTLSAFKAKKTGMENFATD